MVCSEPSSRDETLHLAMERTAHELLPNELSEHPVQDNSPTDHHLDSQPQGQLKRRTMNRQQHFLTGNLDSMKSEIY